MNNPKIFIWGLNGKMGKVLTATAEESGFTLAGGFDFNKESKYPVFDDIQKIDVNFDCIIDFSRPEALDDILKCAEKNNTPCVLATTGYNAQQLELIKQKSQFFPIFQSGNMSIGVNAMLELVANAAKLLYGFDIEIVEKHHNQKVDSPSGTALMLANAANEAKDKEFTYGRHGNDTKRALSEIGIHAVRGGTIAGEHDVIFAGTDEVITISHSAGSKKIFAAGALRAAKLITAKKSGVYNFKNINN